MEQAAGAGQFWQLGLEVPDGASEALTNFVWEQGALGVVEEGTPGAPTRLVAFFPGTLVPGELTARLRTYLGALRALGFATRDPGTPVALADPGWAEAWREHFRPVPVGRSLLVVPPWEDPGVDGRVVIVIEPGRAFGTGHHGSTAGCLAALEAIIARERPARMIDLGTGSGILAVAAARLGVAQVLAIDDDPDAVTAARANAERNGVAGRVDVRAGDAAGLDGVAPVPLLVANLLAATHRALAARYRALVERGGAVVLGGILDAEAGALATALPGLMTSAARAVDGWTTLELRAT